MTIRNDTDSWSETTVAQEFEVQLGKRLDAAVNRGVLKPCINNRGVRWGRVSVTEAVLAPLTEQDVKDLRLVAGDVLVCEGGEIGRSSVWNDELPEAYFLNTLHRLRSKGTYEPQLLVAFLERWANTGSLLALVGKSSLAHLTKKNLLQVNLPMPPPAEQSRIVRGITAADQSVKALERLIAKKQAIKHGMMQQLLTGKTRLPGFTGEWTTGPLKSFLPLQRGFDLPTSSVRPGPYPVVYSNGIARTHAVAMVKGPGVVTGRSGTIGKVHFVERNYWPHNTSLWVTSFAKVDAKFAYYYLSHLGLDRFASGSGVPTFNRNDAHGFEVHLPTERTEQLAIAEVLANIDAELKGLRARLDKARAIKQGMMQQLLTGKTRLPAEEAA